jgi:hypothetical protein
MSVIPFPPPARTDGSDPVYGKAAAEIIRECQRIGLDPGKLAAEIVERIEHREALQRAFIHATGLDRIELPDPDLPPCATDDPGGTS